MIFVTVQGQTYNLGQLVRYVTHIGQRSVSATSDIVDPEPIFGDFRYVELHFSDGAHVALDEAQTRAFLALIAQRGSHLDLDKIDSEVLGTVLVHDTEEGGDIILPRDEPEPLPPTIDVSIPPRDPFI